MMKKTILSLALALVLLLFALPALAAEPTIGHIGELSIIYGNGNDLFIEAGTNGNTSVYYMNGGIKNAVVENQDLSNYHILAGMDGDHPAHTGDVTITMTGGTVDTIYVGHSYGGRMYGNVTIVVSGTATCGIRLSSLFTSSGHGNIVTGKMRLFVTSENVTIGKITETPIDGLVQKSASGWNVNGDAVVPAGCTMEIAAGETVTVPSGAKLTNSGTIINNGVIQLPQSASQFAGSIPTGSGVFKVNLPCLEVESADVDTVMVNGMEVTDPVYTLLAGKVYLNVPQGKIYAKINGSDYCCEFAGEEVELTPYVRITSVTVTPATVTAGSSTELSCTVQPATARELTVAYEIVDAGDTESTVSGSMLTTPYSGAVKLRATVTDGYYTFSEDASITVEYVPVTGIAGDSVIPHGQTVELSSIVLPVEVEPANASYRTIEWSVNGPAVVSGGTLKLLDQGTVILTATVKNGLDKGQDFVKNYTLTATNPAALDISQGDIIIKQDEDDSERLLVRYGADSESVAYYHVNDLITITGQTETYKIYVYSGSPKLLLNNCKITASRNSAIDSSSSDSSMEIILTGTNVLSGGRNGISLETGQNLTIDGTGSLNVSGNGMAAIGPRGDGTCGTITINGGMITASTQADGFYRHAAIGGEGSSGVEINGGTVIADGGTYAAGIGPNVTINGGDVTATGGGRAAGIGGDHERSSTVTIYDGTVKGTSTGNGAGIGGGLRGSSTVTIYGGTVNGTSTDSGAGIGGGYGGSSTVTIHDGTVEGGASGYGAGIGGGFGGNSTVTISGGSVSATGGQEAAGIGGGESGSGTVIISGGSVIATGGEEAAGIGGGDSGSGTVTISGGSVSATGGEKAAGIGGGYFGNGTVTISGGTVSATGGDWAAGIGGGGDYGGNGTVTISGGSVTATGGEEGTGIGGGYFGNGTVTISGGTVTANGGANSSIAVGKGLAGSVSTVIITGGSLNANQSVTATNGEANGSQSVSLKELTIEDLASEAKIASAAGLPGYYGLNDVQTIDKRLYFYLPGDYPTSLTAGGETYFHAGSGLYTDHVHRWDYEVSGNTIIATCIDTSDCPNTSGGSVTIAKPDNLVYSGEVIEAKMTNSLTTGDTVTITYEGDGLMGGKPVIPGTYTAVIALDDEEVSVTYTIAKATLSATGTASASGTYGTTLSKLTIDASGLTVKLGDKTIEGTWAMTGDMIPSIGTASATATFTPSANADCYEMLTAQVTLSIAKKLVTAVVTASDKVYDGTVVAEVKASVNASDFVSDDSIAISGLTGTFADIDVGTNKAVTVVSSGVSITGADNYEVTIPTTATASISKKPLTITASAQNIAFGGSISQTAYTSGELATGDALESVTLTATDTDGVGTGKITPSAAKIMRGADDVTANYDITYVNGVLSVGRQTIGSVSAAVTAPVQGEAPQSSVAPDTKYTGTITWSPAVTDGKFGFNTAYTATVILTPDSNHAFANTTTVPEEFSKTLNADGTLTLTKTFEKTRLPNLTKLKTELGNTLSVYCKDAAEAIALLPAQMTFETETGDLTLDVEWNCGSYDPEVDKTNTFAWAVKQSAWDAVKDSYNQNAVPLNGTVNLTNAQAVPITITGVAAAQDLVYDGTAKQGYTGTPTSAEYAGPFTITYTGTKADGSSYGPTSEPPVDVGEYTVTIAVPATGTAYSGQTQVSFSIAKATPTGEPVFTPIYHDGKTLAEAGLTTVGSTFSVEGTVAWNDPSDTTVEEGKAYGWTFTPTDSGNYAPIMGSVVVYPVGDVPVINEPAEAQMISMEPGSTATMTVSAQGTGELSYQWFISYDGGQTFEPINGATQPSYTTSAVTTENNGYQYYCLVTNLYGEMESPVFTLSVVNPEVLPETGDNSHLALWMLLMGMAGAAMLMLKKRAQN